MLLLRLLSSIFFVGLLVFSIPLVFDVGGRACGLYFSLSLALYYFVHSILRIIATGNSRYWRFVFCLTHYFQFFTIPFLMIYSLNKFGIDSDVDRNTNWAQNIFESTTSFPSISDGVWKWLFGRDGVLQYCCLESWNKILRWLIPVFQIGEGFCSLLVIQAAGQITRWLVHRERGDSWLIGFMILSASVFSSSIYFLYRVTTFATVGHFDAILIGSAITSVVILCIWGIASGRGNPVESSLLFAYTTLCIYQVFTNFYPSFMNDTIRVESTTPPLPPLFMESYSNLVMALQSLPKTLLISFDFLRAVVLTITPSVLISLVYRLIVMYAASRIIPAVRANGAQSVAVDPSLDDSEESGRFLAGLSWFSPTIFISVYTSLLLQHFSNESVGTLLKTAGVADASVHTNVWRWINVGATLALYAIELQMFRDDVGVNRHWKIE